MDILIRHRQDYPTRIFLKVTLKIIHYSNFMITLNRNISYFGMIFFVILEFGLLLGPNPTVSAEVVTRSLIMVTPEGEGIFTQYLKEFYAELSRESGVNFVIKEAPKKRALSLGNSGVADGLAARIPGLQKKGLPNMRIVNVSHYTVQHVVFAKDPKVIEAFNSHKTMITQSLSKGYVVGYLRGSKKAQQLLSALPEHLTYAIKDPSHALTLLAKKRISAYLAGPGIVSRHFLKEKYQNSGIKEVTVVSETQLFPYLHESHKDLIPEIEQAILRLQNNGTLTRLREKFH